MQIHLGKILIIFGIFAVILGIILSAGDKFPLGRLPGDIRIIKGNFRFYFPLTTGILLSAILTLLFWLIGKR
jgi:hypothetical protein